MATVKAIEIRLAVADLKRSVGFYVDVLHFRLGMMWPEDEPGFAILERDGLRLQLATRELPVPPGETESCTLCLDVTGALELHASIKLRVKIDWGPEVYFYHRREFAFKDPDGYEIIISEVTSDPVSCDGT